MNDSTLDNKSFTVVIIGGGFSGSMTAAHLLKCSTRPLKVVLIERSEKIAKGVAYGTTCPLHLLNVPARSMSAFPDQMSHFLEWAQQDDASVGEGTFVQRMRYGVYLETILNNCLSSKPANVEFQRLRAQVNAIELIDDQHARIDAGGQSIVADRVVLALGNLSPANVRISTPDFYKSASYVREPWSKESISGIDSEEAVLLVGTGLTMVDKALELKQQGHKGTIHALSRHGFLPNVHRYGLKKLPVPSGFENVNCIQAMRQLRHLVNEATQTNSADWRQIVDSIRPITQELWKRWNQAERKRFIRHARAFWEVHRHRIAPDVGSAIDAMKESGQLKVHAARLISIEEQDRLKVTILKRGTSVTETLMVKRVINCTGADSNVKTIGEPLIAGLRDKGVLNSDALGLGPHLTDNWALIDNNGRASSVLYAVGPLLKGLLWESIAVPELRTQASQLANHLIESSDPVMSH